MSNPERYPSPEVEITLLQSDLAELFQTNAGIVGFMQPADWEQPVELVLGGKFTSEIEDKVYEITIHLRQRITDQGIDYLFISNQNNKSYWRQINDTAATRIYNGHEVPLTTEEAIKMRRMIRAENTRWSAEDTQRYTATENLYDKASQYAKRNVTE